MSKGVKKYKCNLKENRDQMVYNKHILKLKEEGYLKEAREWEAIVEELYESNQNFIQEMKKLKLEELELKTKGLKKRIDEEEERIDEWIGISTTLFN